MTKTSRFVGAMFVVAASVSAFAQQPSLQQIIERHVNALGGYERIHALHSLVIRGMYHEPGPFLPDTKPEPRNYMAFMRPYYQVIGDPANQDPALREGFDGSSWEYYGDPGVTIRTVGAAAAATRHTAVFLQDPLLDADEAGTALSLVGTAKIGDADAYQIHVVGADKSEGEFFLDAQSYLLIVARKSAPIHAFGANVTSETHFSDYREVAGVKMPFRDLEVELATGEVLSEGRKVIVEVNTITDPAIFSPAPRQQTPLQKFLEQLYMERADKTAVMYSYNLFRRTHRDVETRSGVEFIGYQMVKTGDYPAATELLAANAADYPQSASAQFGLGRALAAAGEQEKARAAFARALQIDPNFKKATDGLNALR